MRPSLLRKFAIITKAANQTMVSHALFSFSASSQVSTPVNRHRLKPRKVVAVASTFTPNSISGIPAHNSSRTRKIPSMIFSSRFIGPIWVKCSFANAVALGVCLISGGYRKYSTSGISSIASRPGTIIAKNQVPQESWICELVALATNSTTSGLGAVAVIKIRQVITLEWKLTSERYLPILPSVPFSGSESKLKAMDFIIGCTMAPPRAVLLGVTGPMTKSASAKL